MNGEIGIKSILAELRASTEMHSIMDDLSISKFFCTNTDVIIITHSLPFQSVCIFYFFIFYNPDRIKTLLFLLELFCVCVCFKGACRAAQVQRFKGQRGTGAGSQPRGPSQRGAQPGIGQSQGRGPPSAGGTGQSGKWMKLLYIEWIFINPRF